MSAKTNISLQKENHKIVKRKQQVLNFQLWKGIITCERMGFHLMSKITVMGLKKESRLEDKSFTAPSFQ